MKFAPIHVITAVLLAAVAFLAVRVVFDGRRIDELHKTAADNTQFLIKTFASFEEEDAKNRKNMKLMLDYVEGEVDALKGEIGKLSKRIEATSAASFEVDQRTRNDRLDIDGISTRLRTLELNAIGR